MSVDFTSIRNHNEQSVFDAVREAAPRYPDLAADAELLADVACVALNRIQPRYIRYAVDYAFYQSDVERAQADKLVHDAVSFAFGFVQSRAALRMRGEH